ncbi:TIGR03086 family protein [Catellatospora sp. TT07R-123]|uniref:TIGR03086 family metal-binding protein n=1 Tax=Catellatospora sp. TT07R-123 TaxID=2733863 RepID=UPI001B2BACB6|nr:TIGR03086 family metal-binding protein [Catellatospora sp. TT07R-123]GHJ44097.1 TIGR03086 family protein [Catellatospora sp. TT07R-123]
MSISELISRAAGTVTELVAEPGRLGPRDGRTPCADFDVHELCEHLLNSMNISKTAVRREVWPDGRWLEMDQPPWLKFPAELASLTEAWSAPGALDGEVALKGRTITAKVGAGITLMELVVHGWDLARAGGGDIRFDDDVLAVAMAQVERLSGTLRGRPGGFGPQVLVAPDANTLDRIVALTGRDPLWHPHPAP